MNVPPSGAPAAIAAWQAAERKRLHAARLNLTVSNSCTARLRREIAEAYST